MRRWRKIENAAVASTAGVLEKTENPIVRLIMEIIQRDSQRHYRIQDMIADSLESRTITLTPDEPGLDYLLIDDEKHNKVLKTL
ncbi:MAG: hypothetical protein KAW91_06475 [candidate division Zixibacteria bacterium]|nr:hypothetical protein [candidate division Zixibacteria bacterium]